MPSDSLAYIRCHLLYRYVVGRPAPIDSPAHSTPRLVFLEFDKFTGCSDILISIRRHMGIERGLSHTEAEAARPKG
jgi:hypothetical protein